MPLHEGQQVTGLQIAVEREQRFRVTVWPSGPAGSTVVDRYEVSLQNRSHSTVQMKDESYQIPDIPPGRYTVVSTAWSGVIYLGQGEVGFDVLDADVTVDVAAGALGEIDGVV